MSDDDQDDKRQMLLKTVSEVYTEVRTKYNDGMDGVDMLDADVEQAQSKHRNATWQKAMLLWMWVVQLMVVTRRVWEAKGGWTASNGKRAASAVDFKRTVMQALATDTSPSQHTVAKGILQPNGKRKRANCRSCYSQKSRKERKTVLACSVCGPVCKFCEQDGTHQMHLAAGGGGATVVTL